MQLNSELGTELRRYQPSSCFDQICTTTLFSSLNLHLPYSFMTIACCLLQEKENIGNNTYSPFLCPTKADALAGIDEGCTNPVNPRQPKHVFVSQVKLESAGKILNGIQKKRRSSHSKLISSTASILGANRSNLGRSWSSGDLGAAMVDLDHSARSDPATRSLLSLTAPNSLQRESVPVWNGFLSKHCEPKPCARVKVDVVTVIPGVFTGGQNMAGDGSDSKHHSPSGHWRGDSDTQLRVVEYGSGFRSSRCMLSNLSET